MQYRAFGALDWPVSALGFGAMRLPRVDGDYGQIDEPLATEMIRYAIDRGVNYVDTAPPYHHGASEAFLGRALQDGYCQRVRLATKMPWWKAETFDDFDPLLDESLALLQTDRVDYYLLHALQARDWPRIRDLGVLHWAEGALADGRIGHLGFSFHDHYEMFVEIVDATDLWTFCQIQYNYMDVDYQAGRRGLEYAASKGLAVVIMEPLRGGLLVQNVPPAVQQIWDGAPVQRTPADRALQWLWDQPEVSVVLSGMSTWQQVVENVESAARSGPGTLTAEELTVVERARACYRALGAVPCTQCRYCLPCPNGVDIPWVFELYNSRLMYDGLAVAAAYYTNLKGQQGAELCLACGACLERCPQGFDIPGWLKKSHAALDPQDN